MYEVDCLDVYGNTIYNFFQWDVDQKIVVKLDGCDKDYLKIAPEVHYCNVKSKKAYVVRSVVSNRDTITADVPNILLQQPYPLLVYIYLTDHNDVSSQRTILRSEIPIRKRAEPHDYLFVENIERITAEQIKEEIEADIKNMKDETIKDIEDKKNEVLSSMKDAEAFITKVKDDAYKFIIKTRDEAKAYIDKVREDTVNYISSKVMEWETNSNKFYEEAKAYITKIKDDAYKFITQTKDDAKAHIDKVKNDTVQYIDTEKAEFESTGTGIIKDTQKIKDDTLGVYKDTVKVAGETADKIEDEIRKMMLENGMELKITDDGNGVCFASIVVKKKA